MIQINVCQWFARARTLSCVCACYIYFVNTFVVYLPLIDTSGRQRWRWRWRRQMAMAVAAAVIPNKMIDWHSLDGTFIRRWFQSTHKIKCEWLLELNAKHNISNLFIFLAKKKRQKNVHKYVLYTHLIVIEKRVAFLFGIFSNIKKLEKTTQIAASKCRVTLQKM